MTYSLFFQHSSAFHTEKEQEMMQCVPWDGNKTVTTWQNVFFRGQEHSFQHYFIFSCSFGCHQGSAELSTGPQREAAGVVGVCRWWCWRGWWVVVHGDIIFHQSLCLLAAPTGSSSRTDEVRWMRRRRRRRGGVSVVAEQVLKRRLG